MTKVNQTVNDAQLKARRTNLGKKNVDELIAIILRKDKTERTLNNKIQELQVLLKEANELNANQAIRIVGFEKDMKGMSKLIDDCHHTDTLKNEQIITLTMEKNDAFKKVNYFKSLCKFRRKVIFTCFSIITILIILLCVL